MLSNSTVFPIKEVKKFMRNGLQINHVLQDLGVVKLRAVEE